jgi:hypothetical protein
MRNGFFFVMSMLPFLCDFAFAQSSLPAAPQTLGQLAHVSRGFVVPVACPPPRSSSPIDPASLCSNPAQYVCDSGYNSFLKKASENQANFDAMKMQVENGGRRTSTTESALHDLVFTKARTDRATALFSRAKTALLNFLADKKKLTAINGTSVEIQTLNQMIDRVTAASIYFGSFPGENLEYNAHYEPPPKNAVYLEAAILAIDQTPESLYMTVLHELSHSIGPKGDFRKDSTLAGNPFQKSLQCLKDGNSVGAKSGDIACFSTLVKKSKDPTEAARLQRYVNALKDNNDTGYIVMPDSPESSCQMGQLDESFADWSAGESYALESAATLALIPNSNLPNGNIDLKSRFDANPALADFFSEICNHSHDFSRSNLTRATNLDAHPLEKDRINDLFLANPILNKAIGCPKTSVNVQVNTGTKRYCGTQTF